MVSCAESVSGGAAAGLATLVRKRAPPRPQLTRATPLSPPARSPPPLSHSLTVGISNTKLTIRDYWHDHNDSLVTPGDANAAVDWLL